MSLSLLLLLAAATAAAVVVVVVVCRVSCVVWRVACGVCRVACGVSCVVCRVVGRGSCAGRGGQPPAHTESQHTRYIHSVVITERTNSQSFLFVRGARSMRDAGALCRRGFFMNCTVLE